MAGRIGNPEWVQIGTQKWATRNLDVTTFRNGDPIPYVPDNTEWAYGPPTGPFGYRSGAAWRYRNDDPTTQRDYSIFYNWYTVNDPRGLAPEGWHVPTLAEWTTLINYLGGSSVAGGKLKETGFTYWDSPNTGATNEVGFSARGTGNIDWPGNTNNMGIRTLFWTATYSGIDGFGFDRAFFIRIDNNTASTITSAWRAPSGYAVRLIKD